MSSSDDQDATELLPRCIASTGDTFRSPHTICNKRDGVSRHAAQPKSNRFRRAQFSVDGTCVISQNEDHCVRSFVLPPDLLDDAGELKHLTPHSTWQSSSNVQTYTIYPGFCLQDPATTLVLCGSADVPLTLRNALNFDTVHASYKLECTSTEQHLTPRSLAFTRDGSYFLVGTNNSLAAFDSSRPGEGPIQSQKLKPRGSLPNGLGTLKSKGLVSALSISNDGLLALGTTEREIALFEDDGIGRFSSSFELDKGLGVGVSDIRWSPNGTYLLVAERQSNVIQIYDVRNTHSKVSNLVGRGADTTQPLFIDVVPTASGYEVWAGGVDGCVRMWTNPGAEGGDRKSDYEFKAHDAPVTSAVWHPVGAVLATASGHSYLPSSEESSDEDSESDDDANAFPDNTMKIWTV